MKNNLWVSSEKNLKAKEKDKSKNKYLNPELISIDNTNFYRVSENQAINTEGEHALILYKKKIKKNIP